MRHLVLSLGVAVVLGIFWHSPGLAAPALANSVPPILTARPIRNYYDQDGIVQPIVLPPAISSRLMLPDLRTLPPSDLEIVVLPDGSRELRLSNTIWNSGAGALELEGEINPRTRMTRVVQNVHARARRRTGTPGGRVRLAPDARSLALCRFLDLRVVDPGAIRRAG